MIRHLLAIAFLTIGATLSQAQPSLPSSFQAKTIHSPEGADIFVRWGGHGPVVVLIHGYAENSDSWAPLAADLMKDHTVVVPDLRGIGRSSKPEGGYDKKTQAKDIRAVVTGLGYDKTFVVAHDIGNMVAYAYAAIYPNKVQRLVVMDAPIPGIEPWSEILLNPGVWHFNFHGPDAERLVAGRERIYFDRIWNDFTADPSKPDEATRNFFAATYAQPGGMRAGFAQFTAFSQDAKDNKIFEQVKLTMPVLAVGGEKSFGPLQAVIMRHVATNVREAVVAGSGHWLMEERPVESVALIRNFLDISSGSKEGQEAQSPQPEKSKPPVKMEQSGHILGIGGVFFKSANRDQMREWYSKHLGLADKGQGAMLPWREHDDAQKEHVTVWTVFSASTKYFDPSPAPFMINYIVDDMDALLDRLKQEGVKIDAKRMDESYGRFAWIYDSDGNKIELWQPLPPKP